MILFRIRFSIIINIVFCTEFKIFLRGNGGNDIKRLLVLTNFDVLRESFNFQEQFPMRHVSLVTCVL